MQLSPAAGWRPVGVVVEGEPLILDGVDVWTAHWKSTGRRVEVAHPSYPSQRHMADVYVLDDRRPGVTFAAGELSNGVWGFFVHD